MAFRDRVEAGRRLATKLQHLHGGNVVVLGLPRGGVPVAFEVAEALRRAAGRDRGPQARGAVPARAGHGRHRRGRRAGHQRRRSCAWPASPRTRWPQVEARERAELERRARRFRGDRPACRSQGRTVVVVDDGIATGSTARAACQVARAQGAAPGRARRARRAHRIGPTGSAATPTSCVCVDTPEPFFAIGQFYADFSQTTDDEVVACLQRATRTRAGDAARGAATTRRRGTRRSTVQAGPVRLAGHLTVPEQRDRGRGVRPRQRQQPPQPPQPLRRRRAQRRPGWRRCCSTCSPTGRGARPGQRVRHRPARPPAGRRHRLAAHPTRRRRRCLSATSAPAPARPPRCGPPPNPTPTSPRSSPAAAGPTSPGHASASVTAPTLLIVGGHDDAVLDLNRQAQAQLRCENRLVVVPGATHLFEEPGTLRAAAEAARDWFTAHLAPAAHPAA